MTGVKCFGVLIEDTGEGVTIADIAVIAIIGKRQTLPQIADERGSEIGAWDGSGMIGVKYFGILVEGEGVGDRVIARDLVIGKQNLTAETRKREKMWGGVG